MLFTRRKSFVFQRPERTGANLRRKWALGTAVASASLILSACDMMGEDTGGQSSSANQDSREAVITSSFEVGAPLSGLAFLPNTETPWTGRIATTLTVGGFDIFNVEGERILTASGPRLDGVSGASNFALRGESFPILFGVDSDSNLRGFVIAEQAETVIEIPLELELEGEWAATCLYETGIGYVDIALLGTDREAAIVRVRDTGSDGLTVSPVQEFTLPYPARDCTAANGDLIVAAPTAGILRVSETGVVQAETGALSVFDITYSELYGQGVVLASEPGTSALAVYDANTLDAIAMVDTTDGLSTQGFSRPTLLDSSLAGYGGMSFSTGLVAGYDRDDGSVKLLAREVVSRAVFVSGDGTG